MSQHWVRPLLAWGLACLSAAGGSVLAQEWKSGVEWREPPVVKPGAVNSDPPDDAIVLFNGTDLSAWKGGDKWLVQDGVAIARGGDIVTEQVFGDAQIHLEWAAPTEIQGAGQGRGNSGLFLMGLYEVQILDSYENPTYFDGQAGAIYKQTPPMVNAMRPPGEWNTYDILFTAPKFRVNGTLRKPACVTLIHNGVVVLNHFEILGSTGFTSAPAYTAHAEKGPLSLQFHNNPVQFRNIWVRELRPAVGERVGPPYNIERKPPRRRESEEPRKEEPRKEEPRKEEPRKEEPRKEEPKPDERLKDERPGREPAAP